REAGGDLTCVIVHHCDSYACPWRDNSGLHPRERSIIRAETYGVPDVSDLYVSTRYGLLNRRRRLCLPLTLYDCFLASGRDGGFEPMTSSLAPAWQGRRTKGRATATSLARPFYRGRHLSATHGGRRGERCSAEVEKPGNRRRPPS